MVYDNFNLFKHCAAIKIGTVLNRIEACRLETACSSNNCMIDTQENYSNGEENS